MRGTPTYELSPSVQVDADLFTRLRFRSQKRAAAGDREGAREDLVTALSLVRGAPFEAASERRFKWLLTGQRTDAILVAAIHDTAHLLATSALEDGDIGVARVATEAALRANPDSDVVWLDMAAIAEAESGREAADEVVHDRVIGRSGDDLSDRTEQVLDNRQWATG